MKKITLKLAALAVVALLGTSCCGGNKTSNCGSADSCQTTCAEACKSACAEKCGKQSTDSCCAPGTSYLVYNPNENPINLTNMNIFFENDKAEVVQVNPNVTRKQIYLNNLMTTIVTIDNGPMAQPDPMHSHPAEQICYIAEGETTVTIGDRSQRLKAGDMFAVPGGVPHTVQSHTKRLVLVDSFNPVRPEFLKK